MQKPAQGIKRPLAITAKEEHMCIQTPPHQLYGERKLRSIKAAVMTAMLLLMAASVANAQPQSASVQPQTAKSQSLTIRLGTDQIGTLKTGEKLSTRVTFREAVKEIICGDLYDPASGTGSFVVQRIDRDVFIKPVVSRGVSNMFVKTGERGENIYNFSLVIVPTDQAYLIVKVMDLGENTVAFKKASARMPPLAPPVTGEVGRADFVTNNAYSGFMDRLSIKFQSKTELTEPPPPSRRAPKSASAPHREPTKRVAADYPDHAKRANIAGEVVVEVMVDEKGKVMTARALSGPAALRNPALLAARDWRFTPLDEGDDQSPSVCKIIFRFHNTDKIYDEPALPGKRRIMDSLRRPQK
jgi:TonB family protein